MLIPLPFTDRALDMLDGRETTVQRHLRKGGLAGFEPTTQAALGTICEKLNRVTLYDVGAHIGFYSAFVEALFPDKVRDCVAFEPTPRTGDVLEAVRKANGFSYELVRHAVSNFTGETKLYLSPKSEASNSLNQAFRRATESVAVPVTTIDHVVVTGRTPPNIIKIDVETYEPFVLQGATKTIESQRPFILFEKLGAAHWQAYRPVAALARRCGYVLYELLPTLPWAPVDIEFLTAGERGAQRQWLLSPVAFGEMDWSAVKRWLDAISACSPQPVG
jgi:FkbM family methyltransferase